MPTLEALPWLLPFALGVSAGLAAALGVAALWTARRHVRPPQSALWGQLARVSVRVPRGGVGRIAARRAGHRVVLPARELEGESLSSGCVVVIVALERGVALVTPLEPGELGGSQDADTSASGLSRCWR